MNSTNDFLTKPERKIWNRTKASLIEKMGKISDRLAGRSMYFRPFAGDDRRIMEIVAATGEKKTVVVQKLVHLALHNQPALKPADDRNRELLEWLVESEKKNQARNDAIDMRFERLEEHGLGLEKTLENMPLMWRRLETILREILAVTSVSMWYLNLTFTKFLEYCSPVDNERAGSAEFANRNLLALFEYTAGELEKLMEHHRFEPHGDRDSETLFIFSKIEKIRASLTPGKTDKTDQNSQL